MFNFHSSNFAKLIFEQFLSSRDIIKIKDNDSYEIFVNKKNGTPMNVKIVLYSFKAMDPWKAVVVSRCITRKIPCFSVNET
jgi:hypothetical protein